MNAKRQLKQQAHHRHGVMTPLVACALLVVMGAVALVLDRLWLDAARVELTTAAESAALAAAGVLVTDDLLRPEAGDAARIEHARNVAVAVAAQNRVAGKPVELNAGANGDVRFGRWVRRAGKGTLGAMPTALRGHARFLETETDPTSVQVRALRTRRRNNPIALFFAGLTGQPAGDLAVGVEASLDNHVIGVRPLPGVPVPALPLAILQSDPAGRRSDTWRKQIEERGGQDRFGYDPQTGDVLAEPDGIPEIVLVLQSSDLKFEKTGNAHLLHIGDEREQDRLLEQIRRGWTADDLHDFGGELLLNGPPVELQSSVEFNSGVRWSLAEIAGQCRICLLSIESPGATSATSRPPSGGETQHAVKCVGLVAGRVMQVDATDSNGCRIVFQPGTRTTRTAVLANETRSGKRLANPYIYKLQLTR
jgi:hypothetical protein